MGLQESSYMIGERQRQLAQLEKTDQLINVVTALLAEQRRTNELLQWFADRAHSGHPTGTGL